MGSFDDVIANADPVYWRLYVNRHDIPQVVCMQWFDEYDYDQGRFLNKKHYESEEKANDALISFKEKADIPLTNLEKLKMIAQAEDK